jgi:hypothetical protein
LALSFSLSGPSISLKRKKKFSFLGQTHSTVYYVTFIPKRKECVHLAFSRNERRAFISFILPVEMGQARKQPTEIENFFAQTLIAAREQMMIVIHTLTHETKELLN